MRHSVYIALEYAYISLDNWKLDARARKVATLTHSLTHRKIP